MKLRKLSAIAVAAVSALFLSACTADTATPAPPAVAPGDGAAVTETADSPLVYIVSKGFSQQFWVAVREGAEAAGAAHGAEINFVGPDNEAAVAQQIEQLQTAVNRRPEAIAFAALSTEASIPLLDDAVAAGIPIIAFDSGVDTDHPVTTVATNNYAAGAEAARVMIEQTGGTGDVAVVAHDQTSLSSVLRRDGFLNYIEANAPGINIVDVQYTQSDVLRAADVTRSILQGNPNLVGIFATNEASAIGAVTGIDELGRTEGLTIIGFDSGQGQIDAINEGRQTGAITQDPFNMGYQTVIAALQAINGEPLPDEIDTGFFFFDADNIDEEHIRRSLYY